VFLLAGLHLFDALPAPWTTPSGMPVARRGLLAALALGLIFGIGHCAVIVAAGSATGLMQRYLDWNGRGNGVLRFRQACGLLVIGAGLYLIWIAA
jgi:cytochrome c-type biogenesis protein